MLTEFDIAQIAVIKILFYFILVLGLFFIAKNKKPYLLIVGASVFSALTYAILTLHHQLLWWGLQGDEIFVGAFMQTISGGYFFSDFFFHSLPPFYPPLYFWLVGGIGYIFGFNGVQSARMGVFFTLLLLPSIIYIWQKLHWRKYNKKPSAWQQTVICLSVLIVADWSSIIFKPYEYASAVLAVFWIVFLLYDVYFRRLDWKNILFYGIVGGLLVMTFYFWFLPLLISVLIFKLLVKTKHSYFYGKLTLVAIVTAVVSFVYTVPLFKSYIFNGAENWQPAFFIPSYLDYFTPFQQISVYGMMMFAGLVTIFFLWKRIIIKALSSILIASYLWQLINFITIILWHAPFLPNKPFLFLTSATLSITGGYGISVVIRKYLPKSQRIPAFMLLWTLLSIQLLGGTFIDNEIVRERMSESKNPLSQDKRELISALQRVEGISDMVILSSGLPDISSYIPLNYYVSYNAHFSHPASHFSERSGFVKILSFQKDAESFYNAIITAPGDSIDALLFYKAGGFYPVFFWYDNYPNGVKGEQVDIAESLIESRYFDTVFEDKNYILLKVKRGVSSTTL